MGVGAVAILEMISDCNKPFLPFVENPPVLAVAEAVSIGAPIAVVGSPYGLVRNQVKTALVDTVSALIHLCYVILRYRPPSSNLPSPKVYYR